MGIMGVALGEPSIKGFRTLTKSLSIFLSLIKYRIQPILMLFSASCTQAFGNFSTHASFQTVFLEDLTNKKAHVLIIRWRLEYNTFRPHSSLNNRPPTPEARLH